MKWDRGSQVSDCTTLLDVLMMLKYKTMLDTNVATLGIIEDIASNNGRYESKENNKNYGIVNVKPIPTMEGQKAYTIQAYYFGNNDDPKKDDEEIKSMKGKVVLVVFCDRDFIRNLKVVESGDDQNRVKETKYKALHSLKYGVLVKTL